MRSKKLFGVMLAIMVGTSMAVLAGDNAQEVVTGAPTGGPTYNSAVVIQNRSTTTSMSCDINVYRADGTIRASILAISVPANGLVRQSLNPSPQPASKVFETAEITCPQPFNSWAHVTIQASGTAQPANVAVSPGLGYGSWAVEAVKSFATDGVTLVNTQTLCHNRSATSSQTVTFALKNPNGTDAATAVQVSIPIKGHVSYLDLDTLFGTVLPTNFQGSLTVDAGTGNTNVACFASMDYGTNQFVYVPMLAFGGAF